MGGMDMSMLHGEDQGEDGEDQGEEDSEDGSEE